MIEVLGVHSLFFFIRSLLGTFFWSSSMHVCGILVPRPGIEPVPSAVEVWSPRHWTAGQIPARPHLEALWVQILPVIPDKLLNLSEAHL